jgi:hypothetical protein
MSTNVQREMPWLAEVKAPVMVDGERIAACRDGLDAVRLCVQLSSLSNETLCADLSIDKGHFSRMMQGRANFPDSKRVSLMWRCGNYAPLQYEAKAMGFGLVPEALARMIKAA